MSANTLPAAQHAAFMAGLFSAFRDARMNEAREFVTREHRGQAASGAREWNRKMIRALCAARQALRS